MDIKQLSISIKNNEQIFKKYLYNIALNNHIQISIIPAR